MNSGGHEKEVYKSLGALNPLALVARGFSEAYIGHTFGSRVVAVYDLRICFEILMRDDGMTEDQAKEYLDMYVIPEEDDDVSPQFVVTRLET